MPAKPEGLWTSRDYMRGVQVTIAMRPTGETRTAKVMVKTKKTKSIVYFALDSLVRLDKGTFLEHLTARELLKCNFLPTVPWCPGVPSQPTTLQQFNCSHGHM